LIKKARFFRPNKQKGKIMSIDRKTSNNNVRIVTTKKGTYVIWYDETFGVQRRLNLSKTHHGRYLGRGRGR